MKNRRLLLAGAAVCILGLLVFWFGLNKPNPVQAAPDILASPVHGGCYIAGPSDCRLHVEPFTINVAAGKRLVYFQLLAARSGADTTVIYDFRPDQSNPLPLSGSTVTPSLVAQDFAATCGATYMIYLQGKDTGDPNPYNLGITAQFTCPARVP